MKKQPLIQGAITDFDKEMMRRAITLAQKGQGYVAPNPMVGCVVVRDGKVIGEGYHAHFGEGHAEVNAINAVEDHSLLSSASLYVTLEPCSHFGKTPPCADLIIRMGIPRVIIGSRDPFESVNGSGAARLRASGIEVIEGVEEEACREMNRRFLCYQEKARPYIVLKWAQTMDGYMDIERNAGERGVRWITGPQTKTFVHQLRAQEAAVMVGRNTIINDNPQLTVREVAGKSPIRIVLSTEPEFPNDTWVLDGEAPTLVLNNQRDQTDSKTRFIKCRDVHDLTEVLAKLHHERVLSVLVEGGAQLLNSFLAAGLWDEAIVITGSTIWGAGLASPEMKEASHHVQVLGDDVVRFYRHSS